MESAKNETLNQLLEDSTWTWDSTSPVAVLEAPPSALEFHRNYVARNVPVVIRGLQRGWRAVEDLNDLLPPTSWKTGNDAKSTSEVNVNVTPNGKGDAVVCDARTGNVKWFVKPEERRVPLEVYFDWLKRGRSTLEEDGDVFYLSAQNDCLRRDFGYLVEGGFAPGSHPYGNEVFGKAADAANLWIGDERAVSCIHRDTTYENLYAVVRGTKVFDLMCPIVAPLLDERPFPTARYASSLVRNGGSGGKNTEKRGWTIELERDATPTDWIEYDPVSPRTLEEKSRLLSRFVRRVCVRSGETLYLPSGWFHRVAQEGPTVAFNWWYDVEFDARFLLQRGYEALMRG